jgi:hypothetical protein
MQRTLTQSMCDKKSESQRVFSHTTAQMAVDLHDLVTRVTVERACSVSLNKSGEIFSNRITSALIHLGSLKIQNK